MSLYKQTLFNLWQTITAGTNSDALDSSVCPEYSFPDITEIVETSPIIPAVKTPFEQSPNSNPDNGGREGVNINITGDTDDPMNDTKVWTIMQRTPFINVFDPDERSISRKTSRAVNKTFTMGVRPYTQKVIMPTPGESGENNVIPAVAPNVAIAQFLMNSQNAYVNYAEVYAHRTISVRDFARVYYTVLKLRSPKLSTFTTAIRKSLIDQGTTLVRDSFTVYVKYEWGTLKSIGDVVVITQSAPNSNFDINGVPIGAEIDNFSAPLFNPLPSPNIPKIVNADIKILNSENNPVYESIFDDVNLNNPGTQVMRQFLRLPETLFEADPIIVYNFVPYNEYQLDPTKMKISSRDS